MLSIPSATGVVRFRYFLPDAIRAWGDEPQRISQTLASVTANTNIPRLRLPYLPRASCSSPSGGAWENMRATSAQMDVAELRQALEEASKQATEQERYFGEIVEEQTTGLEAELSRYKEDLEDAQDERATPQILQS